MDIDDFMAIRWSHPGRPLIEPPRFSPVIADPSFLFPEETPGGSWELFAHSAWGIHRLSSSDGLSWRDRGIVVMNAMRPFVRKSGGDYLLYYEKYAPLALPMTALPFRRRWKSAIAVSSSSDLVRWSRPQTVVGPSLPWMRDAALGDSVSNPCLVPEGRAGDRDGWRLYFSASLSWIDDCGFCEPRYIAVAHGASPTGPFEPRPDPVIDPAAVSPFGAPPDGEPPDGEPPDGEPPGSEPPGSEPPGSEPPGGDSGQLGAGSIKVLRMDDGWIGLQNRIYSDRGGSSRSAIFVLRSEDGLSWRPAADEPLLEPGEGWTRSHVYACDCRFREADGSWYLYFNARDGWTIGSGRERIGRIVGMLQD